MTKEKRVTTLLGNYFNGVITESEMKNLVKVFRDDVERAKSEVLAELKQKNDIQDAFLKKFNSNAVKFFDYSLQKIYQDNLPNYDMIEFVYNNIKKDLSELALQQKPTGFNGGL
ncbi:MAG TPA: hypothetical protein DCP90_09110 [Clostridiales bacterium]|nr:MAG: hypothetical protein A2Y22_02875 [Clostridiales bacterium GWD2_32_59]HAN10753.1 hypothetical protein [Clostridiales bacterium]